MTFKITLPVVNHSSTNILVIPEPWSEYHTLQPDQYLQVIGDGGAEGSTFEIEHTDRFLATHAWGGCVANVYRDGVELEPEEQIIPARL
jgi:hypothetical protein